MMMTTTPSAAFAAPRRHSFSSSISTGDYYPRQLLHTASETKQYQSNASSSSHEEEEEEEMDRGNIIIERQKMRRKHHFRPPSSSLQQHEAIELSGREGRSSSSSITTKHTINDTLCPPTNTNTLQQLVQKHITTLPKYVSSKPIAKHNIEAFNEVLNFITCYNLKQQQQQQQQQQPSSSSTSCTSSSSSKTKVILDSGCGTGRSSYILAQQYKDCLIIGIDQSLVRLCRNKAYYYYHHRDNSNNNKKDKVVDKVMTEEEKQSSNSSSSNSNVLLVRAELSDFWYLCLSSTIFNQHAYIVQHYLLYPNPYPKKSRLQNRFYAHPSFPLLMMTLDNNNNGIMVGNNNDDDDTVDKVVLIVRSNWKGYLDEFKMATNVWRKNTMIGTTTNNNDVINNNDWALQDKTAIIAWKTSGPDQLNPCNIISPMTNFEAKFLECGESIYEFTIIIHKKKIGYKYE